jgi:hypothetical protein
MRSHDAHVSADVFLQQLRRREQIEVEVLLDQGQRARVRQASEQRRLGAHTRAHLAQRKAVAAGLERHAPLVLHQRQALVVDRDRDRVLVGQGARLLLHGAMGRSAKCERHRERDFFQGWHWCYLLCPSLNDGRPGKG